MHRLPSATLRDSAPSVGSMPWCGTPAEQNSTGSGRAMFQRYPFGLVIRSLQVRRQPNRLLIHPVSAAQIPASQASSPPPFASAFGTNQLGAAGGAQFMVMPAPLR